MLRLLFHIIGAHCVSVRNDSSQEYSDTSLKSNGVDVSSTAIPNDSVSRKRSQSKRSSGRSRKKVRSDDPLPSSFDGQDSSIGKDKHVSGRKLRKLEPVSYYNLENPWLAEDDEQAEVEAQVEAWSEGDDAEVETQQYDEPQVSAAKAHAKLKEKLRRFNARLREKLEDVRNGRSSLAAKIKKKIETVSSRELRIHLLLMQHFSFLTKDDLQRKRYPYPRRDRPVEDMRRWLEHFIRKNPARVSAWGAQRHGDIETTVEDYTYAVGASREGGQWIASAQRFAAGIDLETDASSIQQKLQSKFGAMASAPKQSSTSTESPSKAKSSPTTAKSQPKKQKFIPKAEQANEAETQIPLEVVGKKMTIHKPTWRIHSIPDSEYYSSRGELRKYRVYVEPGHTVGHQCDGCLKVFTSPPTLRFHLETRARNGGVCPRTYDSRKSLLAQGPRVDDLWERRKDDHSNFAPGKITSGSRQSSRIKDSQVKAPALPQPEVVTSAPAEVALADPAAAPQGLEPDFRDDAMHFADEAFSVQGILQGGDGSEFDDALFDFDRSDDVAPVITDASPAMQATPSVSNDAELPHAFDYTDPVQSVTDDLFHDCFTFGVEDPLSDLHEGDRPDVHTAPAQKLASMIFPAETSVLSATATYPQFSEQIPRPVSIPVVRAAVGVGDKVQITRPPSEFGAPTAVTDGEVISVDMLNRVHVQPHSQAGCPPVASKRAKRPRKYGKIVWKTMAEMQLDEQMKGEMKHQAARSLVTTSDQIDQPVSLKQPAPQAQKLERETHQCSVCQEYFSSARKLKNHINGFTSVDGRMVCPNFCHHCGLTFVNSGTKSAHDKAHRDTGRCPIPVLSSVIPTDRPLWTHHYTADNFAHSRSRGRCTSAGAAYSDPLDVADALISINALNGS